MRDDDYCPEPAIGTSCIMSNRSPHCDCWYDGEACCWCGRGEPIEYDDEDA